jgi:Ca2+-binding EF-hand superfamily protein
LNSKRLSLVWGKSKLKLIFRVFTSKTDLKALFKFFDTDGNGTISYPEFLNAIYGNLNLSTRKLKMIDLAWRVVDPLNSGECSGKQIAESLVSQLDLEILEKFKGTRGMNLDGRVKREEFENYYKEVATVFPDDEYFVRRLEKTWRGLREVGD